jgi:uncharacterized protein
MTAINDLTAEVHLRILFSGLIWSLMILLVAWKFNFFQMRREGDIRGSSFPLWVCLGAFLVLLTIELVLVPIVAIVWIGYVKGLSISHLEKQISPIERGYFNIFSIVATASGLFLYLRFLPAQIRQQIWGSDAFLSIRKWITDLAVGMSAWFICFPLLIVISQAMDMILEHFNLGPRNEQVAVKHLKMTFDVPELFWVTVLMISCLVPIIEEVLFRGFLLNWMKKMVGLPKAIILSALTFALFHFSFSQGWDNITLLTSLFLLGCFLGFVYERQQSLWASIGLHGMFNAISIWMIAHS